MGKNTMMCEVIQGHLGNNPVLETLLCHIPVHQRGPGEQVWIKDMLLSNKVPSATAGAVAPCEVIVPSQNTGLWHKKTSFFQALGITTKISRGIIEILSASQ
ncbi:60S acidic ribosomal protein P0 [Sciurus carolinensis]|uniref:Large ribosomal subunit protein uL10 n=1 Tax=Sciurus carolinensis TaxID=30640 RepID=A0AA41MXP2_SCICA|nr:60S acidic ribosomal protein P0 [Sciurus carolinensis]